MLEGLGEVLELVVSGHKGRELLTQPHRCSCEPHEPVRLRCVPFVRREGRDDEAPIEKRARRFAHEDEPRLRICHDGVELRAYLALGLMLQPRHTTELGD